MTEFARRSRRVVQLVVVAWCVGAFLLGPLFYFTAQEIQFRLAGVAFVKLNILVAALPIFAALRGVRAVATAIVAKLGAGWQRELAGRHGVDVEQVRELTAHL
jgi:hypothetical protein